MNKKFIVAMIKVVTLCIIIFAVSAFFISDTKIIGWAVLLLGLLCLASLEFFKISIKNVWPDIVFGFIDDGTLAIFIVIGGGVAGLAGAIAGGVIGNAITDGIAGFFEGYMAEKLQESKMSESRTMLGSSVGKMTGCLIGAGIVLIIANLINSTL